MMLEFLLKWKDGESHAQIRDNVIYLNFSNIMVVIWTMTKIIVVDTTSYTSWCVGNCLYYQRLRISDVQLYEFLIMLYIIIYNTINIYI